MFRRIIVAWDGTTVAEHAVRVALDIAGRYGASLRVVSVLETPMHAEAREDRERTVREQTDFYTETLARMERGVTGTSTELQHEFLHGADPAEALRAYAHEHGVDLIVIGRGHRGVVQRALTGDVTDVVAREAHCPVLVVGQET